MDTTSTIVVRKNAVHHERSNHIDTRYHFIDKCIDNGKTVVDHIEHMDNLLTYSLSVLDESTSSR